MAEPNEAPSELDDVQDDQPGPSQPVTFDEPPPIPLLGQQPARRGRRSRVPPSADVAPLPPTSAYASRDVMVDEALPPASFSPPTPPRARPRPAAPPAASGPLPSGNLPLYAWLSQFTFTPGVCWAQLTRLAPPEVETEKGRIPVSGPLELEVHTAFDETYVAKTWGGHVYSVDVFETRDGDGLPRKIDGRKVTISGPPTAYAHGGVRVELPRSRVEDGAQVRRPPVPWGHRDYDDGYDQGGYESSSLPPAYMRRPPLYGGRSYGGGGGADLLGAVEAATSAVRTRREDVELARIQSDERAKTNELAVDTLKATAERAANTAEQLLASRGARDETLLASVQQQLAAQREQAEGQIKAQREAFDAQVAMLRAELERVRREADAEHKRTVDFYNGLLDRERTANRADLDRARDEARRDRELFASNHATQMEGVKSSLESRHASEKSALDVQLQATRDEVRRLTEQLAEFAKRKDVTLEEQATNVVKWRDTVGKLFGLTAAGAGEGEVEPKTVTERLLAAAMDRGLVDRLADRVLSPAAAAPPTSHTATGRTGRPGRRAAPPPPNRLPPPPIPQQSPRAAPPPPTGAGEEQPVEEPTEPASQDAGVMPDSIAREVAASIEGAAKGGQTADAVAADLTSRAPPEMIARFIAAPRDQIIEGLIDLAPPDAVLRTPYGRQFLRDLYETLKAQA